MAGGAEHAIPRSSSVQRTVVERPIATVSAKLAFHLNGRSLDCICPWLAFHLFQLIVPPSVRIDSSISYLSYVVHIRLDIERSLLARALTLSWRRSSCLDGLKLDDWHLGEELLRVLLSDALIVVVPSATFEV